MRYIAYFISIALIGFLLLLACSGNKELQNLNSINESGLELEKLYALALQGDVQQILRIFDSIPNDLLTREQSNLKEQYYKRFKTPKIELRYPEYDLVIGEILFLFYSYWTDVLTSNTHQKSDSVLNQRLAALICKHSNNLQDISMDSIVAQIYMHTNSFLKSRNVYSNAMGKTGNYYDLFLWTSELEQVFDVSLPECKTSVCVVFMNGFLSQGWAHFATFGKYYAAGWAKKDKLYCVKEAYNVQSERFLSSYLPHEAQHFVDYISFPKLEQPDLEYRAKLAELSSTTEINYKLLKIFILRSRKDSLDAHSFANYCVVRDLSRDIFHKEYVSDTLDWKGISYKRINKSAVKMIKMHTTELRILGAERVKRYISL